MGLNLTRVVGLFYIAITALLMLGGIFDQLPAAVVAVGVLLLVTALWAAGPRSER